MANSIKITVGEIELDAELNDSETASRILAELPIRSGFNTWGDEIYFQIPVTRRPGGPAGNGGIGRSGLLAAGQGVSVSSMARPLPAKGDEIRPASPVNPVGRVHSGAEALKEASRADEITIEKSDT